MEKKNIYALGALVLLAVLSIVMLKRPEKGERTGERPRPVPELKADAVKSLEVAQPPGTDKVTIAKQGDRWQVTSPYDKPADGKAVKDVLDQLEKVRWGDITTQQKDRHAEMEVSDDKAVHVVAKDSAGKVLADLYLGKSVGEATMVRVAGKDDVWQAMGLMGYQFRKEGKKWRDHNLYDLKGDEAEKVVIQGGGTEVHLERLPPAKGADGKEGSTAIYDAKWKVVEAQPANEKAMKPQPGVAIDDGLVNGVVEAVSRLQAGEFQDSAKPEEFGLGQGQTPIVVKVTYKGGKTAGLRVGALKGEDYYAQTVDSPQVFTAKKYALDRAAHLPQDIRDKTLTQLKEEDLVEVTVQQDKDVVTVKKVDKAWKADKIADADDNKVKGIAESFSSLSGTGFVAPGSPEVAGLAKPKATVTIKPKAGAPVVLVIGETKGDDVVVQKKGMDPVWVKKYNLERFLKKPADLAKDKK